MSPVIPEIPPIFCSPMKRFTRLQFVLASALLVAGSGVVLKANNLIPKGYNTPIPGDVLTPDSVQTRIGTFNYFDGFPDDETMRKARRQVDLGRGVQTFLNFIPAASLEMLYVGHRDGYGLKPNRDIGLFEELMSSTSLWLTGNTDTVYASAFLDLSEGPVVVEVPPGTGPGTVNDAFFRFVVDMGGPGPDKGKGGKYLILGPGQEAPASTEGYFVARTPSKINWLILRGFLDQQGKPDTAKAAFMNGLKVYPFAKRNNPPANTFKNLTGSDVNTIHANDFKFYEELNDVIQREPSEVFSPELLGMASAIGIQKGKPFNPTREQKALLTEAVAIGNATARSILFAPQDPKAYIYPGKAGYWQTGFPGGNHTYRQAFVGADPVWNVTGGGGTNGNQVQSAAGSDTEGGIVLVTEESIQKTIDCLEDEMQKDFIRKCLRKAPEDRPTARELLFHPVLFEVHSLKLLAAHILVNTPGNSNLDCVFWDHHSQSRTRKKGTCVLKCFLFIFFSLRLDPSRGGYK